MKTLLERWLAGAPAFFRSELGAATTLAAGERMPSAAALCFSLRVSGAIAGLFTVAVDREGLRRILTVAGVTPDTPDGTRDAELWRGLLEQAARTIFPAGSEIAFIAVEERAWQPGLPAAAYELRQGDAAMVIAFAEQAREAVHPEAGSSASSKFSPAAIDLLLDVELEASLRFGSREMSLDEVLELGPGDVVELDRHVSDPVDLLVGDKIVARGEVVLVNGSFGLKVLEVAEPKKALESIRCLF
ncbi:FliM/FliN family flagellar motor switch protein [Silvibacterium acidisoli]|uniref:FliM/FliN family flagellar motor switch protein n=1 Tax=Acidobacteriaceae bacterium ZG23-2 TaxID=2883246 RepID=UPI00406C03C6